MARYKKTESGVVDTENNLSIPESEGNRHWQEYKEWSKKKGNKADPYVEADNSEGEAMQQLSSTDWYVIRKMETGEEVPAEVTEQREKSRAKLDKDRKLKKGKK